MYSISTIEKKMNDPNLRWLGCVCVCVVCGGRVSAEGKVSKNSEHLSELSGASGSSFVKCREQFLLG